jgi:hypothetical protein
MDRDLDEEGVCNDSAVLHSIRVIVTCFLAEESKEIRKFCALSLSPAL